MALHINKDTFSSVFYQAQNGYVYEYNVDGLSERLGLHDGSDGIKMLSQKQNENEYSRFIGAVRSCFAAVDRQQVTELIGNLLREVEDNKEHASLNEFFRKFLDDVYSEDASIDNTGTNSVTSSTFFQTSPQTHQPEPDNTSTPPTQDVSNENAENPTANSDDYGGTATEESEIDAGSFNQPDSEHNEVDATSPQNTASSLDTADATDDELVWAEAEPETEPTIVEEATDEEDAPEQQAQPETDEQKKQPQPSKPFDVAGVDLKKVLNRDNAPKKE